MDLLMIREPEIEDMDIFLKAMRVSQSLHQPWVQAPKNEFEFIEFIKRYKQESQKSYLIFNNYNDLTGVFNISEIVRGCFQNAYLGYYGITGFAGKGYMSAGLKLVLQCVFDELKLHRLEANIQPENIASINLVKRNGFRKEGYSPRYLKINDIWRDHERWALTYEDWVGD